MTKRALVAGIAICAAALLARGDIVRLKNGRWLEGKAHIHPDGSVTLLLAGGAEITFDATQVLAVEPGPAPWEEYAQRRAALKPDNVLGHFLLGTWCRRKGLHDEARAQFETVIAADPDHEGAREALDHVKDGAEWIPREEWHRRRGDVRFEGRWMPPAERDEIVVARAEKARRIELARLMTTAAGSGRAAQEARTLLEALSREERVPLLVESIRNGAPAVRVFAASRAAADGAVEAVEPLADMAVKGPAAALRKAALDALTAIGAPGTCLHLYKHLYSEFTLHRIFALQVLQSFPDPRTVQVVLHSFPLVWKDRNRPQTASTVTTKALRGYELTSSRSVVGRTIQSGVTVGSGLSPVPQDSTEDRMRDAEHYLRGALLDALTGKTFGADYPRWVTWWNTEGQALIEAQIIALHGQTGGTPAAGGPQARPQLPPPLMD